MHKRSDSGVWGNGSFYELLVEYILVHSLGQGRLVISKETHYPHLTLSLKILFPGVYLNVCEKIHVITMVIKISFVIIIFLL